MTGKSFTHRLTGDRYTIIKVMGSVAIVQLDQPETWTFRGVSLRIDRHVCSLDNLISA